MLAINHLPGSTSRSSARSRRATSTTWRRSRRIACPGSAGSSALARTLAVRRGESDRDAVRLMRQAVRDGRALGLFVEGTRQRTGVPGRGAARRGDGRDPGGRAGRAGRRSTARSSGSRGNFAPVLDRGRRADALRRPAEGRPRLQGGDAPRSSAASACCSTGSPTCTRAAARRGDDATVVSDDRAAARHGGDRRLPERRQVDADQPADRVARGGRPRDAGHDARPQGARLRVGRQAVPAHRHGRRRHRRARTRSRASIAEPGARGGRGGRPRPVRRRRARRASRRATRSSPTILRDAHKPVLVLANKIDDPAQERLALEFHRLGLGDPIPLSGLHGHGTGDLLDEIVARLEENVEARRARPSARRRSGSRSSAARTSASRRSSTRWSAPSGRSSPRCRGRRATRSTRVLERGDRTFVLVDTAGLRRKRRQRQGIEYYSELRALEAAERADVALVLIDAGEGIVEGDLAAADVARKAQCSTLVVLVEVGRFAGDDRGRAARSSSGGCASGRRSSRSPRTTGRGIARVLDKVGELYDKHVEPDPDRRAEPLPRRAARGAAAAVARAQEAEPALRRAGRRRARRASASPSTTRASSRATTRYWVENQLRERFELEGVPVAIDFRRRS